MYQSVFRDGLFEGQVALVTGGGTGIGRCIAHELARLGAQVVVAARREEPLRKTCQEIAQLGGKASYELTNIRDEASVAALVAAVLKRHARLDMLVNNAGGQFLAPAESVSVRGFRTVVDLNAVGTWTVCRAAFDAYFRDHGGRIVNITADFRNGFPQMVHTGAARAAVDNMTKTLSQEWGKYGIRVNAVAPGTVVSSGMQNYPAPVQHAISGDYHAQNPSGRLGTESEVSSAAVWLLSPGSSYVNGASLSGYPDETAIPAYNGFPNRELGQRDIPKAFQALLDSYKKAPLRGKL